MPSSWSKQLNRALNSTAAQPKTADPRSLPRTAIVGIGNEFNGDDCVGPWVARRLASRLSGRADLLVIDAGTAPENITGTLRKFVPDLVILIDAVEMGQSVGSVLWLDWDSIEGMDAFTHGLPPAVFGNFLRKELDCQVGLIGIQPASLAFDQPPHPAIRAAITRVVRGILKLVR